MRAEGERTGVARRGAATPTDPLVIDGDRFALGRVFRNLITNAIQATEAGRPRRDRDRRASATASRSRVADTGSGIPAGSAVGDLRRLRDDQAPRPRPRPGDLASGSSSSSTARSPSRAKSDAAPRSRCGSRRATTVGAGRGKLTTADGIDDDRGGDDVSDAREDGSGERSTISTFPVRYFELRTAARAAALQRRDPARRPAIASSSTTTR